MLKKKLIGLLMVSLMAVTGFNVAATQVITSSSVKTLQERKSAYQIIQKTYKDKGIKINYPQITKLSDTKKQAKINEMIKKEAMKRVTEFDSSIGELSVEMNYVIKYQDENFLSILYVGLANVKGSMHPTNDIYTTNIDIKAAKSLVLSDIIKVDEGIINQLKKGKYQKWSKDIDLNAEGVLQNTVTDFVNKDVLNELKDKTAKFYLTKDALVVSISIPHALGDHMELAIDYKNIKDKILKKEILNTPLKEEK